MDESGGQILDVPTMRDIDFRALKQFTVFIENRVGMLLDAVRRFEKGGVTVLGISISEASECACVRFIFSVPERAREILDLANLPYIESDILAVESPEDGHPLFGACRALMAAEVSILQAYALSTPSGRKAALAIMVDQIEMAIETLERQGFHVLSEGDVRDY